MPTPQDQLAALADAVERTMRELGAWSEPPPDLQPFTLPFAMDTMPFEHWLQLVLVPRMREIAAEGAPLPTRSDLAAHAVREFDGRDDLLPLVDVLRRIDELCPPRPSVATVGPDRRRLAAGVVLILLVSGWGALAVMGTNRLIPALARVFPPIVVYGWTSTRAPGIDLQPLRFMVIAAVGDDGSLRATDASLIVTRSLRTLGHGPTAPLRVAADAPPTAAAITAWLAGYGADPDAPAAAEASREAQAFLAAVPAARTPIAMSAAGAALTPPLRAEEPIPVPPHVPEWVQLTLLVSVVLAGALPIAFVVVRIGLRQPVC